jgi:hypothetical protein
MQWTTWSCGPAADVRTGRLTVFRLGWAVPRPAQPACLASGTTPPPRRCSSAITPALGDRRFSDREAFPPFRPITSFGISGPTDLTPAVLAVPYLRPDEARLRLTHHRSPQSCRRYDHGGTEAARPFATPALPGRTFHATRSRASAFTHYTPVAGPNNLLHGFLCDR